VLLVLVRSRSVLWKFSWIMGAKMVRVDNERASSGSVLVTT
jgi:hypothetical protein